MKLEGFQGYFEKKKIDNEYWHFVVSTMKCKVKAPKVVTRLENNLQILRYKIHIESMGGTEEVKLTGF